MTQKNQKIVKIPFQLTVGELAKRLDLSSPEIIKQLMDNGIMASINELIDYETAVLISEELGFQTETEDSVINDEILTLEKLGGILKLEQETSEKLSSRAPIVTVLGHVDHGKTTLLDTLRKTHIAEKESGGITQHISAYQAKKQDKLITFIDTPGHEAFSAMRERGAGVADIAILVVAADDGVKPQTKEVALFLMENKIPTIVAVNKTDKPEANVSKVKQELAELGVLVEGYGGDIPINEISAKKNIGLDTLLETILLVAEVHEFKANTERGALGVVLEAHKDPQKGAVATVIIKTGTLKVGQNITIGSIEGRVRKIEDYTGKTIKSAPPSMPITLIGLPDVPNSSDVLQVQDVQLDRKQRKLLAIQGASISKGAVAHSSQELIKNIDAALMKKFSIIIKSDVKGTLEATKQILSTIPSNEIALDILYAGVGPITETDIQAAQTGNAAVYGFNVTPTSIARRFAEDNKVNVKSFNVIYELVEEVKDQMSELLEPEIKRIDLGRLKVLAIFKNLKKGIVVGGKVMNGKLIKGESLEILRDKEFQGVGKLIQLQHNKQDVSEVKEGFECGITFEGKEKIFPGDTLLCYKEEKIKRKL